MCQVCPNDWGESQRVRACKYKDAWADAPPISFPQRCCFLKQHKRNDKKKM